jgi:hypothetical protein
MPTKQRNCIWEESRLSRPRHASKVPIRPYPSKTASIILERYLDKKYEHSILSKAWPTSYKRKKKMGKKWEYSKPPRASPISSTRR